MKKAKSQKEKRGHSERSEESLFSKKGGDSSVVPSGLPQNDSKVDLGFKVFTLEPSNFKVWRTDTIETEEELKRQMEVFVDPVRGRSEADDMAWEIMLKSGYELTTKIEKIAIGKSPLYSIADGEMILALESIDQKGIDGIVGRVADPTTKPR